MLPASNRGAGGTFAFPDVCLTPAAPAPIPVPYPNFGFTAMSVPFSPTVFLTMVPAINMATQLLLTTGDEGGVAHPTFKGAARFTMGNPIVLIHMLPAIMLCALSTGNNCNAPLGATLIPSIVNVFFTRRLDGCSTRRLNGCSTRRLNGTRRQGAATDGSLSCGSRDGVFEITINELTSDLATAVYARHVDAPMLIDLRGCPGGVAEAALQLADDFLPDGVVLAEREDGDGDVFILRGRRKQIYDKPVAILVDELTASAAEIFAGILQHHGRARLFGSMTYGKGEAYRLAAVPCGDDQPERVAMVAAGEYRLPDGTSLSARLTPNVITDEPETAARAWLRSDT